MKKVTRKPKITYIIDNLKVGGAQVHLSRLIPGLTESFDIEVICIGQVSKTLYSQIQEQVPVKMFEMTSIRNPAFWISFLKLTAHLRASKPDIVHTYLNTSNVFGLIAGRLAGVKRVITSRRDMGHFRSYRIAFIEGILCRLFASLVFCVCNAVAKATHKRERISKRKITVILNGVDIERFRAKKEYKKVGPVIFGMVAAMDREMKGHIDLLEAAEMMKANGHQDTEYWLVGDGHLRKDLETFVQEKSLCLNVKFLGEQEDLLTIFYKIDVLVVPSHSEAISNAALEAMAVGIPVIATAVDGNVEVVINGETGFLVPSKNGKLLCEKMMTYANCQSLQEIHGKKARRIAEAKFGIYEMTSAYCISYDKILRRQVDIKDRR